MSEGQPRHVEFAVVVGPFINDVVSKSEMFDNLPPFVIYFSFVDPSPPLLNKVGYRWPLWIQNKVVQSCLNTSGCSICSAVGQLCVHSSYYTQKKATLLFSGVFFYVGMRTFSMVLLPVNLDHGGIGTFKA